MEVMRARTAGFCMGVSLALRSLDKALKSAHPQGRLYTFGPIIHNPQVLERYARLGVVSTEHIADIKADDVVVIRAHGIPRDVEQQLQAVGAVLHDATCPKVKQAQMAIATATADGQTLLLFGESDHPEVQGLISYAGAKVHVFDSFDALNACELDMSQPHVLAAQTTQAQDEFARLSARVRAQGAVPVLTTICDATGKRQDEALRIASQVEAMVVVGGKKSGNTRRLAVLAGELGIAVQHIETPDELDCAALRSLRRVGLTAGASTPKELIDATYALLCAL